MKCMECGIELMDSDARAELAKVTRANDPNHEVPWRTTHLRLSEEREGPACEVCKEMFATVNGRAFFVRMQREYYEEQAQKRRTIGGN